MRTILALLVASACFAQVPKTSLSGGLKADGNGNYAIGITLPAGTPAGVTGGSTISPTDGITSPTVSRPTNTVVLFGDSIAGINWNASAGTGSYDSQGFFNWANAILGQRFVLTKNAGVGGNTTTQMLARIKADVLDYKPAWCFVVGGANDIVGSVLSTTITANLKAIYQILNANGIRVVALTVPPSTSYDTAGKRTVWAQVNAWIKDYARSGVNNLVLVDMASANIDPTNAAVAPLANTTIDGVIHYSALGAYSAGSLIANTLTSIVPAQNTLPVWATDPTNLVANGFMTGTTGSNNNGTGSASGQVATGWTQIAGVSTCVASKTTRSDGFGAVQVLTMTNGVDGTSNCHMIYGASGWAAGDVVYMQAEILSATVTHGLQMELYATPSNSYASGLYHTPAYPNLATTLSNTIVLRTPNFTIPVGTTNLYAWVGIQGTTGAINIGRVEVRKVVAP